MTQNNPNNEIPKDYRPEAVLDRVLEKVMPKDTVEEFLQSEPMVRLFAVENNAMATGRLGQYHGKTVREALLDFYTTAYNKGVEVGGKEAYEHSAIIREREINDLLFEVMEEAQDSFGNGEKVIKNWMRKNNCDVSPLLTYLPEVSL